MTITTEITTTNTNTIIITIIIMMTITNKLTFFTTSRAHERHRLALLTGACIYQCACVIAYMYVYVCVCVCVRVCVCVCVCTSQTGILVIRLDCLLYKEQRES
jgi:hypothetical protein